MNHPRTPDLLEAVTLDDKYLNREGVAFMTGMQALVRLPLTLHERGVRAGQKLGGYISGYRGSPVGTFDMALEASRPHWESKDIRFQPGVNEELAATAVWGTQQVHLLGKTEFDGVFGIWYGKAPGVDRTLDVFRHGNHAGTSPLGGMLAIAGDDPNAVSSTVTGCSDQDFVAVGMPLLYPSSVQEMLDYGVMGIELSRYSGCWAAMKVVTDIGESSAVVDLDIDRVKTVWPAGEAPADIHIRWPDNRVEQERRLYEVKLERVKAYAGFSGVNQVVVTPRQARLGIVAAGKPWSDLMQALADLGITERDLEAQGVRVLKLGMIYPLQDQQIRDFAQGLDTVLVIEEKRAFIEDQIKSILFDMERRPSVLGKHDLSGAVLVPTHGETSPALVAEVLGRVFPALTSSASACERLEQLQAKRQALQALPPLEARSPFFCSGCPHNSSTQVPEGSLALAGIGCHWLSLFMDRQTQTFTQMGGEGATWLGAMGFSSREHVFANLGDGTYHHSGVLAIRAAVYAGANITYKLLYNDAVAMTGGQMISDSFSPQQIIGQVLAEGVNKAVVVSDQPEKYRLVDGANGGFPAGVSIYGRADLDRVQRELRETPGVTVLLYDQTCAAEKRRRRKRGKMPDPDVRAFINDAVCEGCGDCSQQSNCISVEPLETPMGRKRVINQSACNKDLKCVEGFCPSFVTVEQASLRKVAAKPAADPAGQRPPEAWLPEPVPAPLDRVHETVITGIGGTGVITIGAIVAMAARLEGRRATCLDQTGIAQKNGAVLSHVRVGQDAGQLHAPRVSVANADLVLGCDMMVAASAPSVSTMSTTRTRVVLNTHLAPHAAFVLHPVSADFGEAGLREAVNAAAGESHVNALPASWLATQIFGDAIAANMIMLGYALQNGWLPVSLAAVRRAIEINGVAVASNLAALDVGRRAAVNLQAIIREVTPSQPVLLKNPRQEPMETLLQRLSGELTAYQDAAYARRFLDLVGRVQAAQDRVMPGNNTLARTVAKQAFRLMAYKDEYEVARLYTDGNFEQKLRAQFDGDLRLNFHLAPPVLARRDPDTGHLRKGRYGAWIWPAMRMLARLKGLRGTWMDPFGYQEERRRERQLASSYFELVDALLAQLTDANYERAVQIAGVPESIRGFGHVKDRNLLEAVKRWQALAAGQACEAPVQRLVASLKL